uniref:SSD domain-containing protein n=2 Tax=Scylla olivacea TaxID=85551 RepID=A0A0P4W568_SCYOL
MLNLRSCSSSETTCACLSLQVDVMALMTWWGLTIDTVSCINLVLCIGLCVDYSVHIALHFLSQIFFGVFIFGVFHGLVFLPVLLSLIGPAPYSTGSAAPLDSDNISSYSSEKMVVINGHSYTQVICLGGGTISCVIH